MLSIGFVLWLASASSQDAPVDVDYRESVEVNLIQLEVTVWPENDVAEECLGLTAADFELRVNRRDRKIHAVDWIGSVDSIQKLEGQTEAEPGRPSLTLVLYFDLWHLNLFYRSFTCPITKPLAFERACCPARVSLSMFPRRASGRSAARPRSSVEPSPRV